ncbi:DNA gyrase inhibitor YacG [Candidatus Erwinia haradaeae]|uniref:DNA gyrase inhibitor YacG n=1 Tax=Candidatus Erwinia haradaeae TaxID=1922217 RepID=A0A803GCY0_9GAMM|nr:DNA gyrase inhibitor YacG [Candidatus Erwinia haradaeae]VFP88412.1 DNA gyrase inhibitor YacG [Candidatus Erwinia haradaeae]
MKSVDKVKCPSCGEDVMWNTLSVWRPFCSQHCKKIDLNEWMTEKKYIEKSDS